MEALSLTTAEAITVEENSVAGICWKTGVRGSKIWMGKLEIGGSVLTPAITHRTSQTGLYVLKGEVTIIFDDRMTEEETVYAGDFIFVPSEEHYRLKTFEPVEMIVSMAPVFQVLYDSEAGKPDADIEIIRANKLGQEKNPTENMPRLTGVEASHLWIGRVTGEPNKDSGKHHHGEADTGGYIISGTTRILFGNNYEQYVDMKEGDFVHVPPLVPHIERNEDPEISVEFVTTRNPANIVVNLK